MASDSQLIPASFDERLAAFVVDLIIVRMGATALLLVVGLATRFALDASVVAAVFVALLFPAFVAYHAFFSVRGGATPGKRFMGISVVGTSGPVSAGWAVIRAAAYLLSAVPLGLGFLWSVVDGAGRTWHDLLAGTAVVRAGGERRRGRLATASLLAALFVGSFVIALLR